MLIVFQPEHIVETATRLGRERRRRWRISAMQAGPKKRTSLNGRAALRLCGWTARGVLTKRQVMRA
jgi:hypothetical protein